MRKIKACFFVAATLVLSIAPEVQAESDSLKIVHKTLTPKSMKEVPWDFTPLGSDDLRLLAISKNGKRMLLVQNVIDTRDDCEANAGIFDLVLVRTKGFKLIKRWKKLCKWAVPKGAQCYVGCAKKKALNGYLRRDHFVQRKHAEAGTVDAPVSGKLVGDKLVFVEDHASAPKPKVELPFAKFLKRSRGAVCYRGAWTGHKEWFSEKLWLLIVKPSGPVAKACALTIRKDLNGHALQLLPR